MEGREERQADAGKGRVEEKERGGGGKLGKQIGRGKQKVYFLFP